MKNKEYPLNEAMKILAKSMQDRIDAYKAKLLQLRKREAESVQDLPKDSNTFRVSLGGDLGQCVICGNADSPDKCSCLSKSEKELSSLINAKLAKKAPPGHEEQVKALKPKVGVESAFKIAWAQHNKEKGDAHKTEESASESVSGAKPLCKECGKMHKADECGAVQAKNEDVIDLENQNEPGKRIKKLNKELGKTPDNSPSKPPPATGSGDGMGKAEESASTSASESSSGSMDKAVYGIDAAQPNQELTPTKKAELEKGLFAEAAHRADPVSHAASKIQAAAEPKVKMPSQAEHASRAQDFQDAMGGAFQPPAQKPAKTYSVPKVAKPNIPAAGAIAKPKMALSEESASASESMEKMGGEVISSDSYMKSEKCALCGKAEHPGDCK